MASSWTVPQIPGVESQQVTVRLGKSAIHTWSRETDSVWFRTCAYSITSRMIVSSEKHRGSICGVSLSVMDGATQETEQGALRMIKPKSSATPRKVAAHADEEEHGAREGARADVDANEDENDADASRGGAGGCSSIIGIVKQADPNELMDPRFLAHVHCDMGWSELGSAAGVQCVVEAHIGPFSFAAVYSYTRTGPLRPFRFVLAYTWVDAAKVQQISTSWSPPFFIKSKRIPRYSNSASLATGHSARMKLQDAWADPELVLRTMQPDFKSMIHDVLATRNTETSAPLPLQELRGSRADARAAVIEQSPVPSENLTFENAPVHGGSENPPKRMRQPAAKDTAAQPGDEHPLVCSLPATQPPPLEIVGTPNHQHPASISEEDLEWISKMSFKLSDEFLRKMYMSLADPMQQHQTLGIPSPKTGPQQ
eukprot:ANDGO_02150.mRNA.1 hypothetical protein